MTTVRRHIFYSLFVVLFPVTLVSQSLLLQEMPNKKIMIGCEYMRPHLETDTGLSIASGVYDFSLNMPISQKINLVLSVPFIQLSDDYTSESAIGNILVGIQKSSKITEEKGTSFLLGLFLPTASDNNTSANSFGFSTNFHEWPKYLSNSLTLYIHYQYFRKHPAGSLFQFECGSDFTIPTKSQGRELELFLHYGFTGGYRIRHLAFLAELLGNFVITEGNGDFSDRFTHALGFGVQFLNSFVSPAVYYKFYLKEALRDTVKGVLGIKLVIYI